MRLTFGQLVKICQDGAGKDTSSDSETFFKRQINNRYEQVLGFLPSHLSETTRTFSTVIDQQYYYMPPSVRRIKNLFVTIANVDYYLEPINSHEEWTQLNSIDIQSGAIPRKYFKRQRDFGIWPIPQGEYTGSISYSFRALGMTADDYNTGTVSVTENDQTVTGSGTSFESNVKKDYWFSLADSNGFSRGDWYRIGTVTDNTNLELESFFEGATEAGANYIIGESPDLPEELHEVLAYGALADYYSMFRQSQSKAQGWNNMFWTGDWNNSSRDEQRTFGGVLGIGKRYKDRNEGAIVYRNNKTTQSNDKLFATSISG